MKRWVILVCLGVGCLIPARGRAAIYILIDQPEDQRFPIAVANIAQGGNYRGSGDILKKIPNVIRNDLQNSGYFFVIQPAAYRDRSAAIASGDVPFAKWSAIGARALVKGLASTDGGRTTIELRLFDVASRELQLGKRYTFDRGDWRIIAHRFADEIMLATTGVRGPFSTKLTYTVMTQRSKRSRWKQIYVSDYDGENVRRLTKDNSYNLGPSWSPDGGQIVFASYVGGFPDIYVADLATGRRRRLTANQSTNITPTFSPDGGTIAFSSGAGRDIEIFLMNNIGGDQRAFAPSFGVDIAPTFSPDGRELAFASERGGRLSIYRKRLHDDGVAQRVTFSGYLNDSPDWSPDGSKLAFSRYSGGKYDVFTVNIDGSNVRQVTSFGSNEHPRWSPDSRFLVYSSLMGRDSQIFIMRFDGANKTRITKGKDTTLPDWGPWPADYWRE